MYKLELQWKDFNINLSELDSKMRQDYPSYVGNQAHSVLELWFSEEPSQEDKDAIQAYWDGIKKSHSIAKKYKSQSDIMEEKQNKRESAKAKLLALGLDEDEISALLGN